MSRRTVTLTPNLEKEVRKMQVRMLVQGQRDVSFTEALNWCLADGFAYWYLTDSISNENLTEYGVESADQLARSFMSDVDLTLEAQRDAQMQTVVENIALMLPEIK